MSETHTYEAAIVGGGPVGLFLGCCLHRAGISCIILEKRAEPITHSRSIGIHPVSLELFSKLGLAEAYISEGIKIKKGLAFCNAEHIGTLSFQTCPPPFPFILTLPQHRTEHLLAAHLQNTGASILHRNSRVNGIEPQEDGVHLMFIQDEQQHAITADYVIGCDGKDSFIRRASAIPFKGKTYDDTYIMGDFTDNTSFGNVAAIFLCNEGLIESFPLSQSMRRWVVKTQHYFPEVNREDIEARIARRIGHDLSKTQNSMLSSFGVQKKLAGTMEKNKIILAGDAGHVVSPIGGQGMNLGWLDGWDLTGCLKKILKQKGGDAQSILAAYSKRRLKIARKAARRAEFNMALGRESERLFFRKMLLQTLLKTPASRLLAQLFTMRGLRRFAI